MLAAVLTGHGGPEMVEIRDDVAAPEPGPDEVRVAVAAAAVNNTDIWTREGAYGAADDPDAVVGWQGVPIETPRIQGADVVGRVDRVGARVDGSLVGRRVLVDPAEYEHDGDDATPVAYLGSERDGGFAQYVAVDRARVHDVDDSPLTDEELAALPTAYGTAMRMLARAEVARGERVLVTGASGGVGLAAVQLAHQLGAEVIALTTAETAEAVGAAGAARIVDRHGDVEAQLAEVAAAGADGLDVVVDVVGGALFARWLAHLRRHGRIVVAGAVAGPRVEIDLRRVYLGQQRIIGSSMHTPADFGRLVDLARRGRLAPVVAAVFDLGDLHAAHEAFASGRLVGKVVVRVEQDR